MAYTLSCKKCGWYGDKADDLRCPDCGAEVDLVDGGMIVE